MKKTIHAKPTPENPFALLAIASLVGLLGCSQPSPMPATTGTTNTADNCTTGIMVAGNCCATSTCGATTPAVQVANNPIPAGAASAGAAQSAVTAADQLTSHSPSANTSAATAGQMTGLNSGTGSLANTAPGGLSGLTGASLNTAPGAASGGAGAGSGGSYNGSNGSLSGGATAPAAALSNSTNPANGIPADGSVPANAGLYSAGGAGAAGARTNPFDNLGGLAGETPTKGGVNGVAFGKGGNPLDRAPASGTADPQDYFSRLNPEDSLFKVVERRYQITAMNWAAEPLNPSEAHAPASPANKIKN